MDATRTAPRVPARRISIGVPTIVGRSSNRLTVWRAAGRGRRRPVRRRAVVLGAAETAVDPAGAVEGAGQLLRGPRPARACDGWKYQDRAWHVRAGVMSEASVPTVQTRQPASWRFLTPVQQPTPQTTSPTLLRRFGPQQVAQLSCLTSADVTARDWGSCAARVGGSNVRPPTRERG